MQTLTLSVEEFPKIIPFSENKERVDMCQNGSMTLGRLVRILVGNLKDYVSGLGSINSDQQKYFLFKSYLDGTLDEVDLVGFIKDEYVEALRVLGAYRSLNTNDIKIETYIWKILKVPTQAFAEAIRMSKPMIAGQIRMYETIHGCSLK